MPDPASGPDERARQFAASRDHARRAVPRPKPLRLLRFARHAHEEPHRHGIHEPDKPLPLRPNITVDFP